MKVGDLVTLKSGSPMMTVDKIVDASNTAYETGVHCVWNLGGDRRNSVYAETSLIVWQPALVTLV